MHHLKKILYKPKRTDTALLAQFYFADEDLCSVAAELDSFDGRRHPVRCAMLVAQLRQYQEQVLKIIQSIMHEVISDSRADRSYRVKYPDDLVQDGLAGQLWFGAECLAAGSNILNRETESACMRPLAKSLTKQLDVLRGMLREQTLRDPNNYTDKIKQSLIRFDRTFAEFELSYVSAMVPVKSVKEYDLTQDVTVLFSETVQRSLSQALITSDMIDYYDPSLMFTIPRLAIVTGLVIYPDGPLNPRQKPDDMSEMFRPFHDLLLRIRELLWSLTQQELHRLERLLCNLEEPPNIINCKKTAAVKKKKKRKICKREQNRSLFRDISDLNIANNRPSAIIENNAETGVARAILLPQTDSQSSGDISDAPSTSGRNHLHSFTFNLPTNHNTGGHQVTLNSAPLIDDNEGDGQDREDDTSSVDTEDSFSDLSSLADMQITDELYAINTMTNKTVKSRNQTSEEMMQKLFVCISGVADQLQTNFASDLRNVLKIVFELNTEQEEGLNSDKLDRQLSIQQPTIETPPIWIPDSETENCVACKLPFTFLRRRHHCRNCGMIFCGRCSSNEAPLPNFGYVNAVRVCNKCYMYRVNPFYSEQNPETSSAHTNEVPNTS